MIGTYSLSPAAKPRLSLALFNSYQVQVADGTSPSTRSHRSNVPQEHHVFPRYGPWPQLQITYTCRTQTDGSGDRVYKTRQARRAAVPSTIGRTECAASVKALEYFLRPARLSRRSHEYGTPGRTQHSNAPLARCMQPHRQHAATVRALRPMFDVPAVCRLARYLARLSALRLSGLPRLNLRRAASRDPAILSGVFSALWTVDLPANMK